MLVRSALVSTLAMALCAAPASPSPLLFGGHHGPPKGGSGWGGGGDTPPPPPPPAPKPAPRPGPRSPGASAPAPSSPKAPAAGGRAAPSAPQPGLGAKSPAPGAGAGAATGGDDSHFDPSWNVWWFFHQDEFLKYAEGPQTADRAPIEAGAQASSPDEPVARAIAAVIERERSTEILTGALLGISRLHEPAALEAIRDGLQSTTSRVRELSLVALGAASDESAQGLLESLLRDDERGRKQNGERGQPTSQRTRAFAAYALGLVGERSELGRTRQFAARALSDVLGKDKGASADLQVACALGLGLVKLPSLPGGLRPADDATPWISSERMAAFLEDLLVDKERPDALRAQLPCVLARVVATSEAGARSAAAEAIVTQLQRGSAVSSGVREACIMALGELGQPTRGETDLKIQTALIQAAEHGPEAERCFAWMALSTIAAHEGDGENGAGERAALRKRLVGGLAEVRSRERAWIALALGVLENRRARAGDHEPSAEVRSALRIAFARAQGPEEEAGIAMGIGLSGDLEGALLVGQRLAHNSQSQLVGYELLSIGLAHDGSQRELLRRLLTTSTDPVVVEHAAEALGLIGDPDLTKMLVAGAQANASLEARESHVLALSDVGDRTALGMLCTKLGDENQPPCMRAALSNALGGICDHGARKWFVGIRTLANWRAPSLTLMTGDGQGLLEIG